MKQLIIIKDQRNIQFYFIKQLCLCVCVWIFNGFFFNLTIRSTNKSIATRTYLHRTHWNLLINGFLVIFCCCRLLVSVAFGLIFRYGFLAIKLIAIWDFWLLFSHFICWGFFFLLLRNIHLRTYHTHNKLYFTVTSDYIAAGAVNICNVNDN